MGVIPCNTHCFVCYVPTVLFVMSDFYHVLPTVYHAIATVFILLSTPLVGTQAEYDCDAGFENWRAGWSDLKKSWCCLCLVSVPHGTIKHFGKAAPGLPQLTGSESAAGHGLTCVDRWIVVFPL